MKATLFLILMIIILPSCTLRPPDIHFTGNQTVIERQIIGNYQELEKDVWVIASVQTSTQKAASTQEITGGDPILFRAMKVREYHYEKIRMYKDQGAIGETVNGLLQYIATTRYKTDTVAREILLRTIANENTARKTIFTRALYRIQKKEPTRDDIIAFGKMFAKEQHTLAKKNDWIEESPGKWIRKQ